MTIDENGVANREVPPAPRYVVGEHQHLRPGILSSKLGHRLLVERHRDNAEQ